MVTLVGLALGRAVDDDVDHVELDDARPQRTKAPR
jgi:hypothetical protein